MYIRRDQSNLHFGRQRRGNRRGVIAILLLILGLIALFVWQFDNIMAEAVTLISGEAPTPTPAAATVAQWAYWDYLNGDLDEAETGFAEAVRQFPENVDYLYEYGRLLLLQSQDESGLEMADRAIEAASTDPRGYALKVQALNQLGHPDEAIPVGLAAIELAPNFAPTYAALAWAYTDSGRWEQGVEMAEIAIQLDPNSVDAYRAYAYSLTWIGEREAAAQQLEIAIELQPTLSFLYFELAMSYRAQQNQSGAIEAYERVLAMEPTNTRALLRLCETYYGLREDALAQDYCEQALIINPEYAPAWRQVGMVYYSQLHYTRSIEAFERCVELGSEDIQCWYVRGLAHYYLDQCDQGVPLLEEALRRTQSEQILGVIRQGLRLCTGEAPAVEETPDLTPTPTSVLEEGG